MTLVDSDDRGSGGVKNCIDPSIDMPGQSLLSDIIRVHIETETKPTVDVKHIPSYENVWIVQVGACTKPELPAY